MAATQGALFRCTGVYKSESERARFEEREGAGVTEGVDGRLQGLEF